MEEWLREALAEEQGLHFCPLHDRYVACDDDCDSCEEAKEFQKCLEEASN